MTDLRQAVDDYLRLRRSLGHQMAEAAYLLPDFVSFMDQRGEQTVTVAVALDWMRTREPEVVTTVSPRRITAVRGFARYLSGIDPATEVPPLGLVPYNRRRGQIFLYSDADIAAIMAAAKEMIPQPLRAATYHTLIGLLAASGLRIGEAIKLDRDDIDWNEGVLHIRESKFGKSRLVPLQDSATNALREYDQFRERLRSGDKDPAFFISLTGKRLLYACVHPVFRDLVDTAGVGLDAPHRPRLHELRHTFAVRTLLHWYRTEDNVQAKIPSLSTYMGHREPACTYWYLSAAPELLALAAARRDGVRKAACS
ncbi:MULTISPECIES: tyrosine-type recombinase/integrase [unclassified Streptomyces]|uniref:tyrosine-type recombinase/integrase n=1 Tax=unclassified Streptomyces TaxID=2593676 RepID=UPI002E762557|nr:tyrosine-type recombinase/integrase [Streptomyces sp. JV185]MEE1768330.1 tyrosine-type recombinase/integrase [Streptomyces sp. JV185]